MSSVIQGNVINPVVEVTEVSETVTLGNVVNPVIEVTEAHRTISQEVVVDGVTLVVEATGRTVQNSIITNPVFVAEATGKTVQNAVITNPVFVVEALVGAKGRKGDKGDTGEVGNTSVQYVAGQNLSAGRCVVVENGEAFYFQSGDVSHAGRACGITISSAMIGELVSVQKTGWVEDVSFVNFDAKLLWVGADGELQDTVPTTGVLQKAGIGVGNNKMVIDFSQQIIL
jgi:hypothetical protein